MSLKVKIIISGGPAEGKTTLASEIAALLESLKMSVTVKDIDLEYDYRSDEVRECAIRAMSGREVEIETIQLRRLPTYEF